MQDRLLLNLPYKFITFRKKAIRHRVRFYICTSKIIITYKKISVIFTIQI